MPSFKRYKSNYPGVYYIKGTSVKNGKPERIYYIMYRKNGKLIEEKTGRQFKDDMTPSRASNIRAEKIKGHQLPNKEKRIIEKAEKLEKQNRWTINRLWKEYIANKPEMKGIKTDTCRYNMHIMPTLGNKEPYELSPFDIDRIRVKLSKTLTPQTVKHVLVLIKRIINFGVNKQLCSGLNFKIEMPKVNNLKTEDLNPEQLNHLLKAIEEDPNIQASNFIRMALFTGMRRSELFRLQWQDVDFQRGFIHIRDPKGGKAQVIPMNENARKVLQNHPRLNSEYVFPGNNGKQRTDFKRPINRIKQRAGLPKDFRPLHGLRHVFASILASSGQVDMYTLQKLLTHKSPLMTQRYAHLRDDVLKRASNLMGDLIEQTISSTERKEADAS